MESGSDEIAEASGQPQATTPVFRASRSHAGVLARR